MPEFNVIGEALISPRKCAACPEQIGQFVDLVLEDPYYGRFYLCERCALSAGRAVGMLDPEQASMLGAMASEAESRLALLEAELAAQKDIKLVRVSELGPIISAKVSEGMESLRGLITVGAGNSEAVPEQPEPAPKRRGRK